MTERPTIGRIRVVQRAAVPLVILLASTIGVSATPQDDEVLTWNAVLQRAVATSAPPVPGVFVARLYAIVHSAIFDAVNGIERRYTPIHVEPNRSGVARPCDHSCVAGRRMRLIAWASLSHLLVSICNCLRPLGVRQ